VYVYPITRNFAGRGGAIQAISLPNGAPACSCGPQNDRTATEDTHPRFPVVLPLKRPFFNDVQLFEQSPIINLCFDFGQAAPLPCKDAKDSFNVFCFVEVFTH